MTKYKTVAAIVAAVCGLGLTGAISTVYAQSTNPYSRSGTIGILNRNAALTRGAYNNAIARSLALKKAESIKAGKRKVASGRATTRFVLVAPFNMEEWITRCGAKTPEMRRQYAEEIKAQRVIWNQEVNARSADKSDMAAMQGVAFVLAWEAYSGGQKVTDAQYQGIVKDFRRSLLTDANFQGLSAVDKQYFYEEQMINATDSVRLWRQGQKTGDADDQKASKESGKRYLQHWWSEPVDRLVVTATGFATRGKE